MTQQNNPGLKKRNKKKKKKKTSSHSNTDGARPPGVTNTSISHDTCDVGDGEIVYGCGKRTLLQTMRDGGKTFQSCHAYDNNDAAMTDNKCYCTENRGMSLVSLALNIGVIILLIFLIYGVSNTRDGILYGCTPW